MRALCTREAANPPQPGRRFLSRAPAKGSGYRQILDAGGPQLAQGLGVHNPRLLGVNQGPKGLEGDVNGLLVALLVRVGEAGREGTDHLDARRSGLDHVAAASGSTPPF